MSNENLIPVYEADSQVESSIIEGILKENGIESTTRNLGLPGIFGDTPMGSNPGIESLQILVRAEDAAKAEQIIMDYSSPEDQE